MRRVESCLASPLTGNTFAILHGGTSLSKTISDLSPASLGFTQGETGSPGVQRLINAQLGGQAGWLFAPAMFGLVAAAWQRRGRWPLDRQHQALVLWGGWLATGGTFFSVAGFFHAYYLATIAPPVAALAGIGAVSLWHDYWHHRWRGWLAPVALVAAGLLEAHVLGYFPAWSGWLAPLVLSCCTVAAAVLILLRFMPRTRPRIAVAALGLGLLGLLLLGGERFRPANGPPRFTRIIDLSGTFRGPFLRRFGGPGDSGNNQIFQWVTKHCRAVPASAYDGTTGSVAGSIRRGGQQLYDCGG